MTAETKAPIVIFEDAGKAVEVRLDTDLDTVWLTQAQMADLFDVKPQNITMHLKNVYEDGELVEGATCKDFLQVQQEGGREVQRKRKHYSLDAVISVGYRVSSTRATRFRIWATRVLREHLTRGWTLNRQRFETNARELEAALDLVRRTARSPELGVEAGRGLVDIVTRYAQTFLLLQRYDEGLLTEPGAETGRTPPTPEEARGALATLKKDLVAKKQATELFAQERGDGFESLLGNLDQSVFGEPAYPTVESKAAHLLYFVIKNNRSPTATNAAPPRLPASKSAPHQPNRRARDQRCGPRSSDLAGGGIRPREQGNDDPPDHEHARARDRTRMTHVATRSAPSVGSKADR